MQCVYGTGETGKLGNVGVILPGDGCGNVLCVRVRACVRVSASASPLLCSGMGVTVVRVWFYTVVEHNLTTFDVSRRRVLRV